MFDPREDSEVNEVFTKPPFTLYVKNQFFGIPINVLGQSTPFDVLRVAEDIIDCANRLARFPSINRSIVLKVWIDFAKQSDAPSRTAAQKIAPRLLETYDQQTLFDFLRDEHGFSMHDLMELFKPE